jgi:hypothetical protein
MEISLEGWIVGVLAVLPGFVSAAFRSAIAPGESSSSGEWIAGSIVTSLVFNAITFLGLVLASTIFSTLGVHIPMNAPIKDIVGGLGSLPGTILLWYVAVLYGLAALWGMVSGLLVSDFAPRKLAFRLRLTPVSPHPNVFTDVLDELLNTKTNRKLRGSPRQQVPWLRVRRDKMIILGRLQNGSVDFPVDEPIEVFLSPAHLLETATACTPPVPRLSNHIHGLYLRVLPTDFVEVLVGRADWDPLQEEQVHRSH